MKTSITKGLRRGFRAAGIGAAVAVAIGFTSVGAANADTFVPLQDGSITQTLPGDVVVTVSTTGESANINPSMGSTPVHRNVWVSGSAQVKLSGAGAKNVNYFRIMPGYVVGCQVDITGSAGGGANGSAGASSTTTIVDTPEGEAVVAAGSNTSNGSGGLSANVGITLSPGKTSQFYVLSVEQENSFGERVFRPFSMVTKATEGSVTWADSTVGISGCAGYAQARSFVKVTVDTATATQQVTLWGQPFSIG
ncbi:MspA family porin [Rhodococcus phenolicus]|uniref:MspA family porin n=1 Tax=Rhodococcus phenolicus TaxID=263849 RepID=UPI0008368C7F|nr:MspA family porin [Rhodococcus phenolicus]